MSEDRRPRPTPAGNRSPPALATLVTQGLASLAMGVFPGRCAACDERLPWRSSDEAFCELCEGALVDVQGPACSVCGQAFISAQAVDHVCGRCHERPPPYERLRSIWIYGGPARDAILRYKLHERPYLYKALAKPMADLVRLEGWRPDLVIAVPMSKRGLGQRGYDPAYLLALGLCRRLGWPAPPTDLLRKVRETPAQRRKSAAARRENVRGAYQSPATALERLKGRAILLVDDVVTTGATAEACSTALGRAGASSVTVVTLARTPYD